MVVLFKRAEGASADTKELEYIIALHQTCIPNTRENGTVSSLDIERFLQSRYGHLEDYKNLLLEYNNYKSNNKSSNNDNRYQQQKQHQVRTEYDTKDKDHDKAEEEEELKEEKEQQQPAIQASQPLISDSFADAVRELGGNVIDRNSNIDNEEQDDDIERNGNRIRNAVNVKIVWDTTYNTFRKIKRNVPQVVLQQSHGVANRLHDVRNKVAKQILPNITSTNTNTNSAQKLISNSDETADLLKSNIELGTENWKTSTSSSNISLEDRENEVKEDKEGKVANNNSIAEDNTDPQDVELKKEEGVGNHLEFVTSNLTVIQQQTNESQQRNNDDDNNKLNVNYSSRQVHSHSHQNETTFEEIPNEEYLDVVQILSLLLIPTFNAFAANNDNNNNIISNPTTNYLHYHDESASTTDSNKLSLLPQPPNLIQNVLNLLLQDLRSKNINVENSFMDPGPNTGTGSTVNQKPVINETLVRQLLINVGEYERADNQQLIEEMVNIVCTNGGTDTMDGNQIYYLDHDTFTKALTSDTTQWSNGNETKRSTYFEDVMGSDRSPQMKVPEKKNTFDETGTEHQQPPIIDTTTAATATKSNIYHPMEEGEEILINDSGVLSSPLITTRTKDNCSIIVGGDQTATNNNNNNSNTITKNSILSGSTELVHTGMKKTVKLFDPYGIDYVLDSHTSLVTVIITWMFFIGVCFTYASLFQAVITTKCSNSNTSVTDVKEDRENLSYTIGCQLLTMLYTWLVYAASLSFFGFAIIVPCSWANNPHERTISRYILSLLFVLAYTFIPYLITIRFIELSEEPYTPAESRANRIVFGLALNLTIVVGMLLASSYIWNILLLLVERFKEKSLFLRYCLTPSNTIGEANTKKACIRKINKMLLNATSLHVSNQTDTEASVQYGIQRKNPSDSAALNYILLGRTYKAVGGFLWTWRLLITGDLFDTEGIWIPTRLLNIQFAQFILSVAMGVIYFNFVSLAADQAAEAQAGLDNDLPDWAKNIVPTEHDVRIALYPAAVTAVVVMFTLFLIYIPSAVSTILSYRCGEIPSLGSRYFVPYRNGVSMTYMNTANAVFGLLGSGLLFFLLVGLVIFLFVWEFSRPTMIRILAWGIGLTATIILKMILVRTCAGREYKSFYRIRPGSANYSALALECWFLGLGPSVLIGRVTQFLLAALFWVGRIDVDFLASDVSMVGYHFDNVPTFFIKDLLVHEAHRHPYLERLAQIYLTKLRHPEFVTCAGSVWRQVFVLTLMPWLRKNRVFQEERLLQAVSSFAQRRFEKEEDDKGIIDRFGEDLDNVRQNVQETTINTASVAALEATRIVL